MRVALIGSHNTGKTTVFNMLKKDKDLKRFSFFEEPIELIQQYGFDINEKADDRSQLALSTIYSYQLSWPDSVSDRCILDNYVYALYLNGKQVVGANTVNFLFDLCKGTLHKYHYFFYFPIEFDMEDNKLRSIDSKFQEDIDNLFRFVIRDFQIRDIGKFVFLEGSSQERYNTIKSIISEYIQ